jgi:hypothetical protein
MNQTQYEKAIIRRDALRARNAPLDEQQCTFERDKPFFAPETAIEPKPSQSRLFVAFTNERPEWQIRPDIDGIDYFARTRHQTDEPVLFSNETNQTGDDLKVIAECDGDGDGDESAMALYNSYLGSTEYQLYKAIADCDDEIQRVPSEFQRQEEQEEPDDDDDIAMSSSPATSSRIIDAPPLSASSREESRTLGDHSRGDVRILSGRLRAI